MKNPFRKIISNSALPDTRPQELKDKDYSTKEIVTSSVVPFQNSKITELTATVYNQWYAGSCVPHAFYTQLEYEGIIPPNLSPSQLRAYRKRIGYPTPGSIGVDIYDKIKDGQSFDFPTPEKFTEEQATAMPYIKGDKIIDFKYFQYLQFGKVLTEDIVKDVALGKAVTIFIYATDSEYSREYVEVKDPNLDIRNAYVRHAVCLVPKGDFTENGKQWLAVHDSARFGGRHLRYISYDFLKARAYFGAKVYADDIPVPITPEIGLPLLYCEQGDSGDKVSMLQAYLVKDGVLSKEYVTGYYGALTAKAVLWWQLKRHEKFESDIPTLLKWGGRYWGNQSINLL